MSLRESLESFVFNGKGSDRDLEGQWGDPMVKFDPKSWTGSPCKGKRLSECPSDFLILYASSIKFFAEIDVKRALGWAHRNVSNTNQDDESPF